MSLIYNFYENITLLKVMLEGKHQYDEYNKEKIIYAQSLK